MKIRLADYVSQFLVDNGITHGFTVQVEEPCT